MIFDWISSSRKNGTEKACSRRREARFCSVCGRTSVVDHGTLRHHGDAFRRDGEATGQIMFGIDTDGRILGKHNILVEDRLVDACSTIDGHAVEQNRIDDLGPRVIRTFGESTE